MDPAKLRSRSSCRNLCTRTSVGRQLELLENATLLPVDGRTAELYPHSYFTKSALE